jgi:hypothetical protein
MNPLINRIWHETQKPGTRQMDQPRLNGIGLALWKRRCDDVGRSQFSAGGTSRGFPGF